MKIMKKFGNYIKEDVETWDDAIDDIPDFDDEETGTEKKAERPKPRKRQKPPSVSMRNPKKEEEVVEDEVKTDEDGNVIKPKKKLVRSEEGNVKVRFTTKLKKIFKTLQARKDSKDIADAFIASYRKLGSDISFLNMVDDVNDQLSYLPRNRIVGMERTKSEKTGKMVLNSYGSDQRQQMRLGRIINRLWPDKFNARQVELFVNEYKGEHDMMTGNIDIELIHGKDIYEWYQQKKYAGGGTLGNSCMRGAGKQQMAMYTDNPQQIRMAVYRRAGKLEARALVWTTDHGIFMDRIYYTKDHLQNAFRRYADRNGWMYREQNPRPPHLTVRLQNQVRGQHPYLDTFRLTHNGARAEAF